MAPYESEEDDRRRDRFPRGDRERNGGAPPDPYERRREGGGFKRSYGGPRREDDAKRARTENDLMEPMQSLRQYAQEHDIPLDSEELPEKYANYQDGYYKRLYKQFFDNHKTEEWFKNKYHPLNRSSISTQQKLAVQKRLDAYNLLKSRGLLEGPFLRPENARQIVRLMTAVIHILDGEGEETIDKILRLEIPDIAVEDVMKFGMALAEESDMVSDPALLERPGAILIRSVPAATTAEELEEVCQRSPGFLRLHFFEAIPETKFTRKAIATYKNTVDLKDVCWSISNVKAKGGDLIASVFNESTDRVRISHPLISHKECTQHILHKAARILAFLDRKAGFFVLDSEASIEEFLKDVSIGVDFVSASQNPLVQKIRAAIPGSLDDDETMQRQKTTPDSADCLFERDESLISLLDEVTFYLRVVYSFDLLNYHFFDDEDTLPCRFSVMHIRGQDPVANEQGLTIFKMGALRIFTEEMNRRLDAITSVSCLSNEKMTAYGALNPEDAVEELIKTNTVQLSEEKWLCPLSGKKFKGPEFIRKHIMSKHSEHADAAKAESTFFNNYLFDTNRPTDKVEEPPEYRSMDPRGGFNRDRRRLPPRRDDRSPRKEPFRELPPPIRRPHLAYKDLDAAPDMEVANVF